MPYRRSPSPRANPVNRGAHAVVSARVVEVDGIEVRVVRKRIRNMYLRVKPPLGDVEVSAPPRMAERRIEDMVRERREWILAQRRRMAEARHRAAEAVANDAGAAGNPSGDANVPSPDFDRTRIWTDERKRRASDAIEAALPALLDKWGPIVGRRPTHITLRLMTSRWGSCTPKTGRIRLNLQLGLMEPRFLEYVLVHEMTHLWEHGHGPRFQARMDSYLPRWRELRRELNRRVVL
ncbi:M48 family metallopeptidase [Bifidobacterium platyrrhinorum]|nr:SprT family zinc-dependent metalloprotease [Bifidobacterium platyrrhinorum]